MGFHPYDLNSEMSETTPTSATTIANTIVFVHGLWDPGFVPVFKDESSILQVDVWFSMAMSDTTSTTFIHEELKIPMPISMMFHKIGLFPARLSER